MENTKPYKGQIGTDIEQFLNGIELKAKNAQSDFISAGKVYPIVFCDLDGKRIAIANDKGGGDWYTFDEVPDYFEIRIREA